MSSTTCFGVLIINKAGGLIYHKTYAEGLAQLTANEYLVLASTFHSIHAIASRISPVTGSSGIEVIEAETFKMTCLQTPTGTKFVLMTTPSHPHAEQVLRKVYETYADYIKDPFYTIEMPIRSSTWRTSPRALNDDGTSQEVVDTILAAIEAGFRHFDSSEYYKTEQSLGRALKLSGVARAEFFITSKIGPPESMQDFEAAVKRQLDLIGIDYLDLYLIHTPRSIVGNEHVTFKSAWVEMEKLVERGFVRAIGVSNFLPQHFEQFFEEAKIKPVVNQISIFPYIYGRSLETIRYCQRNQILVEAYEVASSIVRESEQGGPVDGVLEQIVKQFSAEGKTVTPVQVLLAWSAAKGFITVTTSSKPARIQEYLAAGDVKLTPDHVEAIDRAGQQGANEGRGIYTSWK
ncbi:hypothetical protein OIO90_000258 [Microbotryomycetes sp. JL221]|nr:hypothetical protein OIO90_000258 [Microbotryomycetes sp. JL221]